MTVTFFRPPVVRKDTIRGSGNRGSYLELRVKVVSTRFSRVLTSCWEKLVPLPDATLLLSVDFCVCSRTCCRPAPLNELNSSCCCAVTFPVSAAAAVVVKVVLTAVAAVVDEVVLAAAAAVVVEVVVFPTEYVGILLLLLVIPAEAKGLQVPLPAVAEALLVLLLLLFVVVEVGAEELELVVLDEAEALVLL
jgi:hypothetical protein